MDIHTLIERLREAEEAVKSRNYPDYYGEVNFWLGYLTALNDYDIELGEVDTKKVEYLLRSLEENGLI